MKRIISILISLVLLMSSVSVFAHYDKREKDDDKDKGKYERSYNRYKKELNILRQQLKEYVSSYEKRKEIIEKIVVLKKNYRDNSLFVFVGNTEYNVQNSSTIRYEKIMIPKRAIEKGLGAKITYSYRTRTVTVSKSGIVISIDLDNKLIAVNGAKMNSDVINKSSTKGSLILIKFIAETLGYSVKTYDEANVIAIEPGSNNTVPTPDPASTPKPTPAPKPTPRPPEKSFTVNDAAAGTGNYQFEYTGSWVYSNNQPDSYMNDYHWSNKTNDICQIKFVGKQIKLYGLKDYGSGIAEILLDDKVVKSIDYYSGKRVQNVLVYSSPVLTDGQHTLKVRVTGTKNSKSANYSINIDKVEVLADGSSINLALNKPVAASSSDDVTRDAAKAVDNNANTCWYSQYSDPQWIYVDLGSEQTISRVKLNWESAYAKAYRVQISRDAVTWTDVYSTSAGNGGIDEITFIPASARYVRMYGSERATEWGYSLRELEVFN